MSPIPSTSSPLVEADSPSNELVFYINDKLHRITNPDPRITTLDYLRDQGYTGTKLGCGEGGCGACTVVIATPDGETSTHHLTANACLLPLCTLHGKQIITVEGIGCPSKPHAVQERLALGHGSQCGFCTPGIVMSMYGLLKMNKEPTIHDIEDSFEGNLCRCTGYRPILDSFKTFAADSETSKCQDECATVPEELCNIVYSQQSTTNPCSSREHKKMVPCTIKDLAARAPYDPDSDITFPQELRVLQSSAKPLFFESDGCRWFRPTRLHQLLSLKTQHPQAKLVGGNSEIGVEMRLKSMDYRYFIDTSNVQELRGIEWNDSSMTIGVNITLTEFIDSLKSKMPQIQSHQRPTLQAFLSNLRWFAGRQIRNFATVGGNIATGSPISDLNPIFIATKTVLTLMSQAGTRQVRMSDFFKGYRQMDLGQEEVVISAKVPLAGPCQFVRAYKQARRKDDDIAIVNAAFCVQLDGPSFNIKSIDMAYGGMGPTTLRLSTAPKVAAGLSWKDGESLDKIILAILEELSLPYTVVGGMPSYRRTLAASFFKRFWYQTARDIKVKAGKSYHNLDEIERQSSYATQAFGPSANHDPTQDTLISQSLPHLSALPQTTGAARYVDDIPKVHGELYAYGVLSSHAHAEIISVDAQEALDMPGVVRFVSHVDVPGHNSWGILIHDEEFFATKEVHCAGQLIGLILAETKEKAKMAARLVKVNYKPLPFVLTIEDAIQANSFYSFERKLSRGVLTNELFSADDVVEISGECHVGGQEHFYLETQGCLVVPKGENGEMEVFTSSQNLAESQVEISRALNLPSNRITVKAKRLGGGFGGKETRATVLTVASAVAVHVTGRPVRWVLDRDVDMLMSGNRHPFYGKYRLAITRNGFFRALDLQLIANAGCTYDLSRAVLERAVTHCDNAYYFPVLAVRGKLAKTNLPSNTAFRGFGGPQGMMVTEMMIAHVCTQLGLDAAKVRQQNFYTQGQLTHFKMPVLDWHVPEMWDKILASSCYSRKLEEIAKFNSSNMWRKRGIAAIPTKFAISFGQRFLNQAGATVLIYTDGSVLLSHGGVEIGQGLHTKMVQLCANALKVPLHNVYIAETSTDKVPNASATAASASSDLNGMAVLDACRQLNERLKPYRDQSPPDATLGHVASLAYMDMVSLSAHGFYKAPVTRFDWEGTGDGSLFLYFTTGAAVAQVEMDVLTGDHVVVSADLIMDIGNSINFSIDLGQIEGAFVQGMGWCTTEENLVASNSGRVITLGPGNYKIPGFRDVPQEFNVTILKGKTYSHLPTVKSSKGIGEPPLFLGASVYFALYDAVQAARRDNKAPPSFPLPFPGHPRDHPDGLWG
ncbi:hypothetical protein DSO57_1019848 [Entomophthora muscae]|uniref:Uncharacterized protein n=2 Tax=Entomophthora muscae TaxID=34485 RepID=A0ACC2TRG9_9FUNG|nr:hypothetical protein DSO57_1019848 [Entomophthora muscae]